MNPYDLPTVRKAAEGRDARDRAIAKLRADNKALLEALKDAEHLCKWLLQSGIRPEDRERVIRENGINFAALIEHSEPQ